jgi:hypothetical protein
MVPMKREIDDATTLPPACQARPKAQGREAATAAALDMPMKFMIFQRQQTEPMPPDRVLRSSWRVGRCTVTMTQHLELIPGSFGTLRVEWAPAMPRKLSKAEWRQYRAGRDAHHQRIADITGAAVACAEL